jgi:PhoPQ-activated pathogenicity-related protein
MAVLSQVPNQPLYGGKKEDALIAFTFQKFLLERDPTWPLLLPMVKSAVRAMDVAQAFLAEKYGQKVERFFVTGASKRGWTTWLTGAVDPRVGAMAPMVIDVVNIPRQMRHQIDVWGAFSMSIGDYTELGLTDMVQSEVARPLISLVDPFSYRDRLTMPKLILLGTNDSYWPVDAAKHYFFDLPGDKHLHYVPNAGHGLDMSIIETLTGYFRKISRGEKQPRFDWHFECDGRKARLVVTAETKPHTVDFFTATAEKRDFRKAKWTPVRIAPDENGHYVGAVDVPSRGFAALYGALTYRTGAGEAYKLCTNAEVFPMRRPGKGNRKK